MNITIRINTDSTAFEKDLEPKVFSVLQSLCWTIAANGIKSRPLHDSNGQVCGSVEVQESEVK